MQLIRSLPGEVRSTGRPRVRSPTEGGRGQREIGADRFDHALVASNAGARRGADRSSTVTLAEFCTRA
jgi:hypothetical protein